MKVLFKKVTTMAVAMAMAMGMTIVPAQAATTSFIEDIEYDGKGVVDVEFSKDVKYKNVKVTVKDNKGKKYKTAIIKKDSDDIKFRIKKYKNGRKYTFSIKGVKKWNAKKYKTVKGKVRVDKKYVSKKAAPAQKKYIDLAQAKRIAVGDAGFTESQVKFIKAKFEIDDGIAQYDIEFVKDNVEYEYELNAKTGKIIEKDYDIHRKASAKAKKKAENIDSTKYIGVNKAKDIALKDANLTSEDVEMIYAKLDYEDGEMVYEVEFYTKDGMEGEYEIDAITGVVHEGGVEYDD